MVSHGRDASVMENHRLGCPVIAFREFHLNRIPAYARLRKDEWRTILRRVTHSTLWINPKIRDAIKLELQLLIDLGWIIRSAWWNFSFTITSPEFFLTSWINNIDFVGKETDGTPEKAGLAGEGHAAAYHVAPGCLITTSPNFKKYRFISNCQAIGLQGGSINIDTKHSLNTVFIWAQVYRQAISMHGRGAPGIQQQISTTSQNNSKLYDAFGSKFQVGFFESLMK